MHWLKYEAVNSQNFENAIPSINQILFLSISLSLVVVFAYSKIHTVDWEQWQIFSIILCAVACEKENAFLDFKIIFLKVAVFLKNITGTPSECETV